MGAARKDTTMPLFGTPAPVETNGSDLLDDFEAKQAALVAEFRDNAIDRADVVQARLAALEAEAADLATLQSRIDSITAA